MYSLYCFQFVLFSICGYIFTLFTYFVYYSDVIATTYLHEIQPKYDYVIVGCGTAGSVIAHRLATETNYTFIVLEAGARSNALLEAPVLGPFLHGSVFDWQYQTVPQEHACLGMKDKKCKLALGKIVGGSSKLNNMVHVRGNISHYRSWFHGKYDEIYFKKQFDFIEENILHLSNIQYESGLSDAILDAAKELGYSDISSEFSNIDSEFSLGFMKSLVSQKNGKRWSTSDKLDISKHVISNVLVENIIFNGNTAQGVTFSLSNKKRTVFARKGVIITAGAINTPKILQLSGIGPEKLLNSLGIPVLKNLPVGNNLQDHTGTGLDFILFNNSVSINSMDMINPYNVLKYLFNGKGPWTTPGCEVIGTVSTKNKPEADLLFMVLPVGISSDRGSLLRNNVNINDDVWNKYFSKSFDSYAATIMPIILHPKSKGRVCINSTDPKSPPLFDPKYLSHKDDRETLINGLKIVLKMVNTKAIKSIGGFVNPLPFPGCEQFEMFTDSYFDCYIKHLTLTTYHPTGTCSIGLSGSKNTVVDTSFQVLGLKRLYIADASVLPTMPSGNINAVIAMMASVFFDANISDKKYFRSCFKNDFIYEKIFRVCYHR